MNTNLKHNEKIIHELHLEGVAGDTSYIDGELDGKYTEWNESGQIIFEISTFSKSCQEIFDIKPAHLLCLN